jgi:phenylacetate-CoA ligase
VKAACHQSDRGVLEVVGDGGQQTWSLKQTGRALATYLLDREMPLVRGETGEQIHWQSFERAESGIGWPRIGPVDGRTGDVIALPSGRKIPMPGLTLVMRWMDGLKSYQFNQTGANAITVRLERDPTFVLDDAGVLDFLRQRIGADIEWRIVWTAPELTRNGKLLIIRNDWLRANSH